MRAARLVERLRDLALPCLLGLSAFLQFYRLDDRQLFLGDQALHAQVAQAIVRDGLRPLVGPPLAALSGTNMGPIFYYLSALPVWLSGGWPTGGAALVGLFQVATVYLLYQVGRLAVGMPFGLTAAALYAASGVVVYWHRMLWPNMVPFCAVAVVWALLVLARRPGGRTEGGAVVVLVAALCMAVQLQPTAFVLVPLAAGGWLLARPARPAPWALAGAGAAALLLLAPLIVNEATTGFSQTRAWAGYLGQTRRASTSGLHDTLIYAERAYRGLVGVSDAALTAVLGGLSLVALVAAAWPRPARAPARALLARLCLLWGALFALALALGHQTIYPHYFIPLFPLPFLGLAFLVEPLWRRRATAVAGLVLVLVVGGWNVQATVAGGFGLDRAALLDPSDVQTPNIGLGTLRQVTRAIAAGPGRVPYNFDLLSPTDYPLDYKYLLRLEGAVPHHLPVARKVVVVEPAYLAPATWPAWVAQGLAGARPRYWLFDHVAVWAWDTRGPLPAFAGTSGPGTTGARFVSAVGLDRASRVWTGSPLGVSIGPDSGQAGETPHPLRPDGAADQPAALLVDSSDARRAYAATVRGVATTRDSGVTWQPAVGCTGRAFALLAPRPGLVLAGDKMGLCISRDGGRSWRQSVVVTGVGSAVWERAHPQPVYALWTGAGGQILGGSGTGLLFSADGITWGRVAGIDVAMTALAVAGPPTSAGAGAAGWGTGPRPLYVGTSAGVLRSTTGGRTWRRLDGGMASPYIFALARTPATGGAVVWAATGAGLFRLDPGQERWSLVQGGWVRDAAALSLATRGRTIVVGTDSGAFRSDGGTSWRPLSGP